MTFRDEEVLDIHEPQNSFDMQSMHHGPHSGTSSLQVGMGMAVRLEQSPLLLMGLVKQHLPYNFPL